MNDTEEPADPTLDPCDRCGKETAGVVGDESLCESCYHGVTSCCGLFCDDDG